MSKQTDTWLYWGLGITGFLALVSFGAKTSKPKPPDTKPETKSVDYTTESSGKILTHTAAGVEWGSPKLAPDTHEKFRAMVRQWKELVEEASLDYHVPENWIWAIMWAESRGDPKATSNKGAMGLMQVMPFHFKSGEEPYDPKTNIRAGVRYLQTIRGKVGDLVRGASMYNAGGPWTNESWLAANRNPIYTTKWGYPAARGYIDTVVAANNTYLTLGVS